MNINKKASGILLAVFSATIFGTHPTLVYFLRSGGMGISATLLVSCIQCLVIYTIVLVVSKKTESIKISRVQFLKLLICSFLFYSTLWALFFSFTRIPSGLASVIHFAYPILVTIISVLTKRNRLTKALVIALVSTFLGVILVSNPSHHNLDPAGIFFAGLSAVIFSSYIYMINDESLKELNSTVFVFYTALIGAVILLTAIITESSLISSSSAVWGTYSHKVLMGALTLGITQGIGVFSFAQAIKFIGGPMGGAFATFEPLTAVLIGVLFFAETMPFSCITGCLLILGSTIYLSVSELAETQEVNLIIIQ